METEGKKLYKKIKSKTSQIYKEELHCPMVIDVMLDDDRGTIPEFCVEAGISDRTFWRWIGKYELFDECYRFGKMTAQAIWEKEGRDNHSNKEFNFAYWRSVGYTRFGAGKNSRIRLNIDASGTPDQHYTQMMKQASDGAFTAAELKLISEVINVGLRTQEVICMQEELETMKDDLLKMERNTQNHEQYQASDIPVEEEDKNTVAD